MKLTFLLSISICFSLVFLGCNDQQEVVTKLEHENSELKHNADVKDSILVEYFKTIDEIEINLSRITQSENTIVLNLKNGIENKKSKKRMIIEEIQFINSLLKKNKNKITQLSTKLASSNIALKQLQTNIDRLNQKIVDKDHDLMTLKNQLVKKNFEIGILNNSLDSLTLLSIIQEELINMQEEEINTAYFCYGTKRELRQNGVISKDVLSKSKKLNEDFNKSYFQKIDITKTYSIPLAVKKATLVTNHPTESFKFIENKTIEKMIITDPKQFWEASKYLVILVE